MAPSRSPLAACDKARLLRIAGFCGEATSAWCKLHATCRNCLGNHRRRPGRKHIPIQRLQGLASSRVGTARIALIGRVGPYRVRATAAASDRTLPSSRSPRRCPCCARPAKRRLRASFKAMLRSSGCLAWSGVTFCGLQGSYRSPRPAAAVATKVVSAPSPALPSASFWRMRKQSPKDQGHSNQEMEPSSSESGHDLTSHSKTYRIYTFIKHFLQV